MVSIRGNDFIAPWAYKEWFKPWMSIRGNDFIAPWTYAEIEYVGRFEYDFQKSRVTSPWDQKVSVSVKKSFNKISCLCTIKRQDRILNGGVGKGYPKPDKLETGFGKQKDKVLNHQWWHLFVVSICYFFESSRFQIENCSTNHPPLMFSLSSSPYKCTRRGQKGALFCWDKFAIAFLLRILQLLAEK
jgi:hypothetical protein